MCKGVLMNSHNVNRCQTTSHVQKLYIHKQPIIVYANTMPETMINKQVRLYLKTDSVAMSCHVNVIYTRPCTYHKLAYTIYNLHIPPPPNTSPLFLHCAPSTCFTIFISMPSKMVDRRHVKYLLTSSPGGQLL